MIDDKFIDGFIDGAEKVSPNKNRYIFTFNKPTKYVTSTMGIFAPYRSIELKKLINNITVNDRVYIHWFHNDIMQIINILDSRIPVYLFFWGGDFIEQSKDFCNFNYDPLTKWHIKKRKLLNTFHLFTNPLTYARLVRNYFLNGIKSTKSTDEFLIRKNFLNRINYFCHWNKFDFEIICKVYECSPTFLNFFYGTEFINIQNIIIDKKDINTGTTIWLGNSDTETNNHLDAISVLTKFKNNKIKILCPLSYGNIKYGNFIQNQGQKIFKSKWNSLRVFFPLQQYLKLLGKVDIVVMYHNRTQAAGNIFASIKMGKKVYIKKQSTIYQFLQTHSMVIFDANTIKNVSFDEFSKSLTYDQSKSNNEKISNLFSEEKRIEYLNTLLN